jgi:hypothetical protein
MLDSKGTDCQEISNRFRSSDLYNHAKKRDVRQQRAPVLIGLHCEKDHEKNPSPLDERGPTQQIPVAYHPAMLHAAHVITVRIMD